MVGIPLPGLLVDIRHHGYIKHVNFQGPNTNRNALMFFFSIPGGPLDYKVKFYQWLY